MVTQNEEEEAGLSHKSMLKEDGASTWTDLHSQNQPHRAWEGEDGARDRAMAAVVPLSEVSPHSPQGLGHQAKNALCYGLSFPSLPHPSPHSHPGLHWEKRREGGQKILGSGSR